MTEVSHCPLCGEFDSHPFHTDKRRDYLRCQNCRLVHVPPKYYLNPEAERAEYDKHENLISDPGYRTFLSRLSQPMLARLPTGARGLDFGCGPGPALADMLSEGGCSVDLYDVFYQADETVLHKNYDFICATEVVEHLHQPGLVFGQLWERLDAGGYWGIMTKLVLDKNAFASWHYKNDLTHVCFFSRDTLEWWAAKNGAKIEFIGADVIILSK